MRPLNNFRNILYNKARITPIISILAIQIAVIVFMLSIGVSFMAEVRFHAIEASKILIPLLPETKISVDERQKLKEDLQKIDGVIGVIDANYSYASSKLIFFGNSTGFINVQSKDMRLIENALGMKNISGRLPDNSNEIMLSSLNLNAFKANVGDKIGRYASESFFDLTKDYTVSGTFEGDANVYLAVEDDINKLPYIMLVIKPDKYQTVDSILTANYKTLENDNSYKDFKGFEDMGKTMLSLLGAIAISIFSFGIWVSVMNLMKNNITARKSEFSFLRSIGYNKKYISKRVFVELFVIMLIGYLGGILVGELALIIFNSLYCIPQGLLFILWDSMYASIPAFITLILFLSGYFTINGYIRKLDWVSAMEEAA